MYDEMYDKIFIPKMTNDTPLMLCYVEQPWFGSHSETPHPQKNK
jgi:hypothetical protein